MAEIEISRYIEQAGNPNMATFPEGFARSEQAVSGDRAPRLLATGNLQLFERSLEEIMAANGMHPWQQVRVPVADRYLYIAMSGFDQVIERGEPSQSPTSQARYFARHLVDGTTFLIQAIDQNSVTSRHFHPDGKEVYHCLHGEAHLLVASLNGQDRQLTTLKSGESYVVGKDLIHTVRTTRQGSVMLLEMIGANGHNYVEQMDDKERKKVENAIAELEEGLLMGTKFDTSVTTV